MEINYFNYIGQAAVFVITTKVLVTFYKNQASKIKEKKAKKLQEVEKDKEIEDWEIGDLIQVSPEKFGKEFVEINSNRPGVLFATLSKWNKEKCEAVFNNGLSVIFLINEIVANHSFLARKDKNQMTSFMEKTKNKPFDQLLQEYQKESKNTDKFSTISGEIKSLNPEVIQNCSFNFEEIEVLGVPLIEMHKNELDLVMDLAISFENYELAGAIKNFIEERFPEVK